MQNLVWDETMERPAPMPKYDGDGNAIFDEYKKEEMRPYELAATFPEAKGIVARHLRQFRKFRKEFMRAADPLLDELMRLVYKDEPEEESGMMINYILDVCYERPLRAIDAHIARLEKLDGMYHENKKEGDITQQDVEAAKRVPIGNYIEITRTGFANCLWHADNHPSAKYYQEKNKIWCYVCNEGHDVIDIVQKIKGVDFLDAVKIILGK